jgi:hypothetical protein
MKEYNVQEASDMANTILEKVATLTGDESKDRDIKAAIRDIKYATRDILKEHMTREANKKIESHKASGNKSLATLAQTVIDLAIRTIDLTFAGKKEEKALVHAQYKKAHDSYRFLKNQVGIDSAGEETDYE